jgi:hypothetical protein
LDQLVGRRDQQQRHGEQPHAGDQPLAFDAGGRQCGIGSLPELVQSGARFLFIDGLAFVGRSADYP